MQLEHEMFRLSKEKKRQLIDDTMLLVKCSSWEEFTLKRLINGRKVNVLSDKLSWLMFEDKHKKLFIKMSKIMTLLYIGLVIGTILLIPSDGPIVVVIAAVNFTNVLAQIAWAMLRRQLNTVRQFVDYVKMFSWREDARHVIEDFADIVFGK